MTEIAQAELQTEQYERKHGLSAVQAFPHSHTHTRTRTHTHTHTHCRSLDTVYDYLRNVTLCY